MVRYCPNCGSVVPVGSLTCPQCYTEVPRGNEWEKESRSRRRDGMDRNEFQREIGERRKDMRISRLLSIIPAFFGFLGVGMIYQDHRDRLGWIFLVFGLIVFWCIVGLVELDGGILSTVLAVVGAIALGALYFSAAAAAYMLTSVGSLSMFGRYRSRKRGGNPPSPVGTRSYLKPEDTCGSVRKQFIFFESDVPHPM